MKAAFYTMITVFRKGIIVLSVGRLLFVLFPYFITFSLFALILS